MASAEGVRAAAPDQRGLVEVQRLRELAGRVAPVVLAGEQLLPVDEALRMLFPAGGLRRGSVVSVEGEAGAGATSLLYRTIAAATAGGSWAALVGMAGAGLVAAAEAGVALERLAVVPQPGGHWPLVTAALLDAFDLVVLRAPTRVRHQDARRLAGRARERGGVLLVAGAWPEGADVRLQALRSRWEGVSAGHGFLRARRMEVATDGRGAAARRRLVEVAV